VIISVYINLTIIMILPLNVTGPRNGKDMPYTCCFGVKSRGKVIGKKVVKALIEHGK